MYATLIDQTISQVYQKGVATKILQGMDRIRNEFDEVQARRWPTELLQNARDLGEPGQGVRVRIELTDDCVRFSHSGRPFSVKDILSILNQVSSKKPGEGVGRFGTGFLSTFQLSMKVDVRSYLKEPDEPYRPFQICLDRSGATQEDITAAIHQAVDQLKSADRTEGPDALEPGGLNTEFCYHLQDERGRKIAAMGVEDMRHTLPFVMLFSQKLEEVVLDLRTGGTAETLTFRRGQRTELPGGLIRQEILVGGQAQIWYAMERDGLTLAAAWDQAQGFLPLAPLAPRLYIDFPLVGSDQFPFPVVVNSLRLRPNEPRSGISLVEHAESVDGRENRALMDQAVAVYQDFFSALLALDRRGIANLISIPPQRAWKEWSAQWVEEHLYQALFNFLAQQPLLPANGSFHALAENGVRLVRANTPEQRAALGALWSKLRQILVPQDGIDWYAVFAAYPYPQKQLVTIRSTLKLAGAALRHGFRPGVEPVEWLAGLYDLGMETEKSAIQAGELAIFPSQRPEDLAAGTLYTAGQIRLDPDIPERLKDCTEALDQLEETGSMDLRRVLLHRAFRPKTPLAIPQFSLVELTNYIITRSDRGFRVKSFTLRSEHYLNCWHTAWRILLSTGPDRTLYGLCHAGWQTLPEYEAPDARLDPRMWNNACRSVLCELVDRLQSARTLDTWAQHLARLSPDTDIVPWLTGFYNKVALYLRVSDLHLSPILPNQYGVLCSPAELKLDQIGDETIKTISVSFRERRAACDLPRLLLDGRLQLPAWNLPAMHLDAAAAGLNAALQDFLAQTPLADAPLELQEACTLLLGWIQEHMDLAQRHFPFFCKEEDQMKLLTPRAAVSLRKKADQLNMLLSMSAATDISELERLIRHNMANAPASPRHDPESGLLLDEDWLEMDDAALEDRLFRIGAAGERLAFQAVVDHLQEQGFLPQSATASLVTLARDGQTAEVFYPDGERCHQSGWDIRVTFRTETSSTSYYLEVKTHTPRSRLGSRLPLSNRQMQMAAALGDRFIVLLVIYDEAEDAALSMRPFQNIPAYLASGQLQNDSGRYMLAPAKEVQALPGSGGPEYPAEEKAAV